MFDSLWIAALWTVACQPPLSMDFPGKNTGACCHFYSRGASQHRDRPHISCRSPALQADSLSLSHGGSPPTPFFFCLVTRWKADCHRSLIEPSKSNMETQSAFFLICLCSEILVLFLLLPLVVYLLYNNSSQHPFSHL